MLLTATLIEGRFWAAKAQGSFAFYSLFAEQNPIVRLR